MARFHLVTHSSFKSSGSRLTFILPPPDVTGPADAKKAIILIYDIFGASSQVIQGADRLAQHFSGCLVVMPDFFKGNPLRPDQLSNAREIMKERGAFGPNVDALLNEVLPAIRQRHKNLEEKGLGCFGLCWGGKIAVLAANAGGPEAGAFQATGQAHPARLDVEDAKKLQAPHLCMASKNEDKEVVAQYAKVLADHPRSVVVTYEDMFHGWMGHRANLSDAENRAKYEEGYSQAAAFFHKHL